MNKKAFSLMEILISISIFSIIILALYSGIDGLNDDLEKSSKKIKNISNIDNIKNILMEDFLEAKKIKINKNSNIVNIESSNTYHNMLFIHIVYVLTKDGILYRIESPVEVTKKNIDDLDFSRVFVDILLKNVDKFKVIKGKKENYLIFIKQMGINDFIVSIPYIKSNL